VGNRGQADDGAPAAGRVAEAAAELYAGGLDAFIGRRAELAAAARSAGDRGAAREIGALRKPTRAAWVVNRLARSDPSAPSKLAELAAALRAAQQARHGPRLRELSAARGALVDALTGQALAAAGLADPPPQLRLEVTQTLTAALADPGTAAEFAAGRLTRAVQWSGFGVLPADAGEGDTGTGAEAGAGSSRPPRPAPSPGRRGSPRAPGAGRPGGAGRRQGEARQRDEAARQAAEAELVARQLAELADERRARIAEAEQAVAAAAEVAAAATSAEDALEAEVRDLEGRLDRARAGLASARRRARQAESAERRTRQALERLPPP
jgi:hypothetical protein